MMTSKKEGVIIISVFIFMLALIVLPMIYALVTEVLNE